MLGRRRTVVIAAIAAVVLSGGTAWAAAGVARPHVMDATDVSTSSTDSTDSTLDPSSTSSSTASTETTETTDTTDTTVAETTSTTEPESSTTVAPVTALEPCKPGWGYGDKNHCHSGPPGLQKREDANEDAHAGTSGAPSDDSTETDGADQEHGDQEGAD